jgi:Mce-associated membrane protein
MPRGGADNPNDTPDVESTADLDESTAAVVDASERTEPAEDSVEATEDVTEDAADEDPTPEKPKRQINWTRVFAYGVLPGIALVLAMTAGYLKWQDNSVRDSDKASAEAMQMANDSTVKMLSYKPESVDKDLNSARDLLTGEFRDQYTSLINDVVIPGAQQKKISAVATVPAAATVSADPNKAVMLLFVNQTVVVGQDAPTDTASSVRVTLEKSGDHWLISHFDPV